jgi:hypothetical protein
MSEFKTVRKAPAGQKPGASSKIHGATKKNLHNGAVKQVKVGQGVGGKKG